MWIRHRRPTALRLFRTCAIASATATLGGGLALYVGWALTDYDEETGQQFWRFGELLVGMLGVALGLYYPWGPQWAAANGCKAEGEP